MSVDNLISVACPDCGHVYRVRAQMAGKMLRCKHCPGTVPVPAYAPAAAPSLKATILEMPGTSVSTATEVAPPPAPPVSPAPPVPPVPSEPAAPQPATTAKATKSAKSRTAKAKPEEEQVSEPMSLHDILTLPLHGDDLRVEAFALATGMLVRMLPLALVLVMIPGALILCRMMEMTEQFTFNTTTILTVIAGGLLIWIASWAAQAQLGIVERFATNAVVSESRLSAFHSLLIFLIVLLVVLGITGLLILPSAVLVAALRGDWMELAFNWRLTYLLFLWSWAAYAPLAMAAAALENTVNPIEVFRLMRRVGKPYAMLVVAFVGLLVALSVLQEAMTTLPPAWIVAQINPWTLTLLTLWIGWSAYVCVLGMTGCLLHRYEFFPEFERSEFMRASMAPTIAVLLAAVMVAARVNPMWSVNPITPSQRINGMWRLLHKAADKEALDVAEINRLLPDLPQFIQTYLEQVEGAMPHQLLTLDKGLSAIIRNLPEDYDPAVLMAIPPKQAGSFPLIVERVRHRYDLDQIIARSCDENAAVRYTAARALQSYFPFKNLDDDQLLQLTEVCPPKTKRLIYERIQDEIFARWSHKLAGSFHLRFTIEWRDAQQQTQLITVQTLDPAVTVTSQDRRVYVRTSLGGRAGLEDQKGNVPDNAGVAWAGTLEELTKLGVILRVDLGAMEQIAPLLQLRNVTAAEANVLLRVKGQQWEIAGLQHTLPRYAPGAVDTTRNVSTDLPGVSMVKCDLAAQKVFRP